MIKYLHQAINLAKQNIYAPHPNPRVGCVIVNDNEVVGMGAHQYAGSPHAEVMALGQAKERAVGATCYVTLEPCIHHGRTGPCAEALLKAKVAKVVVGMLDPNPLVAGKGIQYLKDNGIEVVLCQDLVSSDTQFAEFIEHCKELNLPFLKRQIQGRPYVRLKTAQSLDAKVALSNGQSQWITGEQSRADIQRLRYQSDVIITGSGTVLADNPQLTVRDENLISEYCRIFETDTYVQPLRAILDRHFRVTPDLNIFKSNGPVWIYTREESLKEKAELFKHLSQVTLKPIKEDDANTTFLTSVLKSLSDAQYQSVLLECGPILANAFLIENLVDEMIVYIAPKLLGQEAKDNFLTPIQTDLSFVPHFKLKSVETFEEDIKATYRHFSIRGA